MSYRPFFKQTSLQFVFFYVRVKQKLPEPYFTFVLFDLVWGATWRYSIHDSVFLVLFM